MLLNIKKFDELTPDEIWQIYRLRCAVFVVEQNCVYQDIDEYDKISYHVFYTENGSIIAYLRVLPQNTVFDSASIGRVLCTQRRKGIGSRLVKEGVKTAAEKFGAQKVAAAAQTYVKEMYQKLGFVQTSGEFLEDGIPHIKMIIDTAKINI